MTAKMMFSVAAIALTITATPALTQTFADDRMFNFGKHSGIVMWAVKYCSAKATEALISAAANTKATAAFKRGFDKGFADGYASEKEFGRPDTCTMTRMLYGPSGLNVPGLME